MILKYTVQSGDTLSKIAEKIYGDMTQWPILQKYNPFITDANQIYPGQILEYPAPGTTGDAPKTSGAQVAVPSAVPEREMSVGMKTKIMTVGAVLIGVAGALLLSKKT